MMTLALLSSALILDGPNFVDNVFKTDDKFVRNFISHESVNIDSPLVLWFSFTGQPSNLSGELTHKSVSYSLFDNYNPTASPVIISPLNEFFGENFSGNWQFKINSDDDFELRQWGIATVIPEPSTFSLLLLGSALFYLKRKQ